jgi:hypothetical protein
VEAMKTSWARHPHIPAADSAILRTESMPAKPVNAFAFPLLAISIRAVPAFRFSRHQSTGAEAVFDCVKTPATCVPGASTANTTSLRPVYRTFASPTARRTPASGGSLARVGGASGDTDFNGAEAAAGGRGGRAMPVRPEETVFAFLTGGLISLLRAISGAESSQVPAVPD